MNSFPFCLKIHIMEKVVVKSRVYNNHKIMLNGGPVQFVGGRAEVSEELYQEIVSRKLPDIYKEGEEPEFKTRLEEKLRSEVKEGNKEYEEEIKRLKNIVEAQKVEISKKEKEIEVWKKCVEDLKAGNKETQAVVPELETKQEVSIKEEEDDEVKTALKKMKVDELKELAMTEDGGSFKEEDLKGKKKEEIIDMILSK
nr:MAG TPA: hypothetical protein [Caudoviricetes sp.]